MKISEARQAYSAQLGRLRERKTELLKQKKENEKAQNHEANKGVILELSQVEEQYDAARKFMEKFSAYEMALHNMEVAKQQGEAMAKHGDDMAKCLEIARRIGKGDRVPAYDEKKLMDYSFELYMAAKNMALMNQNKKHKDHDSLWKEEEESTGDNKSAAEIVGDMECTMEMPADISAE